MEGLLKFGQGVCVLEGPLDFFISLLLIFSSFFVIGLGEMFGDRFAHTCVEKLPLELMGGQVEC